VAESDSATLTYVALGDSWPAGEHMAHCQGESKPFPVLWAEHLETQTGAEIEFYDFTGVGEGGNRALRI